MRNVIFSVRFLTDLARGWSMHQCKSLKYFYQWFLPLNYFSANTLYKASDNFTFIHNNCQNMVVCRCRAMNFESQSEMIHNFEEKLILNHNLPNHIVIFNLEQSICEFGLNNLYFWKKKKSMALGFKMTAKFVIRQLSHWI
jgi:hypothetical protein